MNNEIIVVKDEHNYKGDEMIYEHGFSSAWFVFRK